MKTKTINLYKLEELSEKAQQKAHNEWVATNEYTFLEDGTMEN